MVLRAKVVASEKFPSAGVHARLLYQKKSSKQAWLDVESTPLNKLKHDESVAIDLHADEVERLRHWLNDLQALKDQHQVPPGDTYFIGIKKAYALRDQKIVQTNQVLLPNVGTGSNLADALLAVLSRPDLEGVLQAATSLSPDKIASVGSQMGASALQRLLEVWDSMPDDAGEEDWQKLLTTHAFALQQVFHVPTIVVDEKAYVGGKLLSNSGGNVVDFLVATRSTSAVKLIEIKKPSTALINPSKPYRNHIWNASSELSGSIIQVLTYRESLMEDPRLLYRSGEVLTPSLPGCAVIIGNSAQLDCPDKRRSFEIARSRPDLTVLTFDEVRARLQNILSALKAVPTARSDAPE